MLLVYSLNAGRAERCAGGVRALWTFPQRRREERGADFSRSFLPALGHKDVIEAGATFGFRVAKKPGSAQLELIRGPAARTREK